MDRHDARRLVHQCRLHVRAALDLERSLVPAGTPEQDRTGRAVDALGAATLAAGRTRTSQGSTPRRAPLARQHRVRPGLLRPEPRSRR